MKKRFKQLPLIIGGLSALALGTVGFSAWVIAGTTETASTTTAQIAVGTLDDRNYKLAASMDNDNLSFDSPAGQQTVDDPYFDLTSSKGTEDLTISAEITLTGNSNIYNTDAYLTYLPTLSFVFESTHLEGAKTANAIQVPTVSNVSLVATGKLDGNPYTNPSSVQQYTYTTSKTNEKTTVLTFTFNFAWGSAFNYKNPVFLTKTDCSDTGRKNAVDAAFKALEALKNDTIKITVNGSATK